MKTPILIVYGIEEFSGYMKSSLEATKLYQVTTTSRVNEAVRLSRDYAFRLAIIDLDLSAEELVKQLAEKDPPPPVVGIVGTDNLINVEPISNLLYRLLTKPVILTDIPRVAAEALAAPPGAEEIDQIAEAGPAGIPRFDFSVPPWLTDQNIASGYLDMLKDDSDAVACRLYVGGESYASSGEIPSLAGNWINSYVRQTISEQELDTLLVKFVRLPELDSELTAISCLVVSNIALYVIFNGYTDFGVARRQADHIARSLAKKNPAVYFQETA
jgi:ActR/RegA family two-component response regulator